MSKRKNLKVFGIIGKVLLILAMLVCVAVDIWFIYIKLYAPERIVSTTHEVEDVRLADGTARKMIEIEYYSNDNNNGLEMFEIKFNYLMDETRTAFYSQGIQYVATSESSSIGWDYYEDEAKETGLLDSYGGFWGIGQVRVCGIQGYYESTADVSKYQSSNDFATVTNATNPIDQNSMIKMTLGPEGSEKIYGMKFKWDNIQMIDANKNINTALLVKTEEKESVWWNHSNPYHYFAYADVNFFARCMYESIQSLEAGKSSPVVFEFANLFNYYECTDEAKGEYKSTAIESDLLTFDIKNYFGIQVTKHADGAQRASDSMFNCINGNPTFNLTGDYSSEDYFYGKTVINCDIYDFDYLQTVDTNYTLKLSEDFVDYYAPYASSICLSIEIDLDVLKSKNINFVGFSPNSGLDDFTIYECYTLENVDNSVVRTEVTV